MSSTVARAGNTLVSRSSDLRAVGTAGSGSSEIDLAQSHHTFDRFAEHVGSDEPSENGLIAIAYQYSVPGVLGASGAGLEGAFAEGHVRAGVVGAVGSSSARSALEMTFQVEGGLSNYTIGAAVGAIGGASVNLELTPLAGGTTDLPVIAVAVEPAEGGSDGAGKSLEQSGLLAPGQYLLQVHADASALPGQVLEADAYFSFNFQLSEAVGGGGIGGGTGEGVGSGGTGGTGGGGTGGTGGGGTGGTGGGGTGGTGGGGTGGTGGGGTGGTPPAAVPFPAAVFSGGGVLAAMAFAAICRRRRMA